MSHLTEKVEDFMRTQGFPVSQTLEDRTCFDGRQALSDVVTPLRVLDGALRRTANEDLRVARLHLIVEETFELARGLKDLDEVDVADALTDLLYVVVGSFVTWGLPMEELFDEVHRSNMTKNTDGGHKPGKGETFSPPNLAKILNQSR